MLVIDRIRELFVRVMMLQSLQPSDPLHKELEAEIQALRERLQQQGIEITDYHQFFQDIRVTYTEQGKTKEASFNHIMLDAEAKAELRYRLSRL
jgi:hypothetical protein